MVQLLNQLPVSNIDRCLTFPIYLAGCLAENSVERDLLKERLQGQHDGFCNTNRVLRIMETAWQRRDNRRGPVEWQELLQVPGRYLPLLA